MQLGNLLDQAKHRPAVVHPVTFRIALLNAQGRKTNVDAAAVLVHVDEEERMTVMSEAAAALAKEFKGKPITDRMREEWDTYFFLAVALRDKADSAVPFAESGPAQLRLAMVYSVAEDLASQYRAFIEREYHPKPTNEDLDKLKQEATGK